MAYIDDLRTARDALVRGIAAAGAALGGLSSYSLDGESQTKDTSLAQQLQVIDSLIRLEEDRSPGRREMRIVRGRWRGSFLWR